MPRINLAIDYAEKVLKTDQENGFAYRTLAEAYAVMYNEEKFYQSFEAAVRYGYADKEELEEPWIERYLHQPKMDDIIERYGIQAPPQSRGRGTL